MSRNTSGAADSFLIWKTYTTQLVCLEDLRRGHLLNLPYDGRHKTIDFMGPNLKFEMKIQNGYPEERTR